MVKIATDKMRSSCKLILTTCFVLILLLSFGCTSQQNISIANDNSKNPLEFLFEGIKRFHEDHPIHPDQILGRIRELKKGQHPFAVVISFLDSRVPPKLLFDQGIGGLFVIRNAWNLISDYESGIVKYAVEHLETKLVVVHRHKQCGAIGAFLEQKHGSVQNHIQSIIDYIKSDPEETEINVGVSN